RRPAARGADALPAHAHRAEADRYDAARGEVVEPRLHEALVLGIAGAGPAVARPGLGVLLGREAIPLDHPGRYRAGGAGGGVDPSPHPLEAVRTPRRLPVGEADELAAR